MEVTVDNFGRILLPKSIREQLGIKGGSRMTLCTREGEVSLRPIESEPVLEYRDGVLVFVGEMAEDPIKLLHAEREERIRQFWP